ncbi:MAG: hypothetical protein WBD01_04765 [Salaquimonas sp.]
MGRSYLWPNMVVLVSGASTGFKTSGRIFTASRAERLTDKAVSEPVPLSKYSQAKCGIRFFAKCRRS